MQKRISTLPFHDTPEQAKKLDEVIEGLKGQAGAVMPALHQAQDIYGYLPMEVQKKIADGLGVSLEEVYGVLLPVQLNAQGPQPHLRLPWHGLLCKGL